MYQIYSVTFKTTGKKYIGLTGIGVFNRIHKHYINAISGIDTHFYRAIRLYGAVDMIVEVLTEVETKQEAIKSEKYYINKYDTVKNGYNSTKGGEGGYIVPANKRSEWIAKLKKKSKGSGNANFSGISNEELLDIAVKFYIENNYKFIKSYWLEYCKQNKLPRHYTKYRFGGGMANFIKAFKNRLDKLKIPYDENSFKLTKEERYSKQYQGAVKKYANNNKKEK